MLWHRDRWTLPPVVLTVTTHKLAELQDVCCTKTRLDISQWVICSFYTTKDNTQCLLFHICCMRLLTCWLCRLLKVLENNLSPPHCSLHGERDKSTVPFNTKGRQSKTEEDSLTVWGRLVAHNRCYSLINNSLCQGWASAPHPSEAPVY